MHLKSCHRIADIFDKFGFMCVGTVVAMKLVSPISMTILLSYCHIAL